MIRLLAALVVALASSPLLAQGATPIGTVVSTDWLAAELSRPGLVVLQIGSAERFAQAHVPGSQLIEWPREIAAPAVEGGLRLELPDSAALQATLRAKGVSQDSRIVLVFDQPTAFTFAGRVFFTLEWAGLRGLVALLDGGLPAWTASAHSTAKGAARVVARGDVVVQPQRALVATLDSVRNSTEGNGRRLVDARAPQFYNDEQPNNMPRGGHIPSAVNLPFSTAINAEGRLKSRAELEALVAAAGLGGDDSITTYCHIGQQASWMYFVLRTLGRDVTMYDGSFDEWSRTPTVPVAGSRAANP